ncbi:MAG: transposase [Isosphaeraceae bacterium]|nr:transposase [Isosphaeraceae bacterium]
MRSDRRSGGDPGEGRPGRSRAAGRGAAYRERNRVERLLGKAKEFRRIATRYERLKATFLGMIHRVFGFIRLRAKTNVNTA